MLNSTNLSYANRNCYGFVWFLLFQINGFFFFFKGLFYVHSVANSMERMSQGQGNACQVAAVMESRVSNGDTGGLKRD